MPIFNIGAGEPYRTPVLNGSYPQDASKTVIKGNSTSASFSVSIAAAGHPDKYTYQWYVDGVAVSGATASTYTKSGLTDTATYNVHCVVTSAAGSVQSRTAKLSVTQYYTPTLNSSYPANASKTYISGGTASATFETKISTAGVPASYTYQWYVNGAAVSGATGSSYTWSGTEGSYTVYCKVTNAAGSVNTRTATLSVTKYYKPTLNSSYPANVTVMESANGSATFKVTISTAGVPASYTYQWYVNNSAVSGATGSSYTKTGLTAAGSYSVYCKVTNSAGTVTSRTATLTVQTTKPAFTYSGTYSLVQESTYRWKLKFLTSGVVNFSHLGCFASGIDVFCVGGGGSGAGNNAGMSGNFGGGGGGGYTKTSKKVSVSKGTNYTITIGAGGTAVGNSTSGNGGGATTAFSVTANGGKGGNKWYGGGNGGSGGGAGYGNDGGTRVYGGKGGSDGGDGEGTYCGTGQGTTTREFGETGGTLYAGGGGGGNGYAGGDGGGGDYGKNGATNYGGGGGADGYAGGSGIAVIRDAR